MNHGHDYDSTFKTLKQRHKRLFISVINEAFHKNYPLSTSIEILPSDGFFINRTDPSAVAVDLEQRDNDSLIRIGNDYYLLECQTYDDDSMALRIAEYTFLAARNYARGNQGNVIFDLPYYTVIYIKRSANTPRTTNITCNFPGGESVNYSTVNVFLDELTKEEIISKKLYVYIPFYIARYEKELVNEKDYEKVITDLEFFRDQMILSRETGELTAEELGDLSDSVNKVIVHITDGNEIEGEVTGIMGGQVYELLSDRIRREVHEEMDPIIADMDSQIADRDSQLADKDSQIADMNARIIELEAKLAELSQR